MCTKEKRFVPEPHPSDTTYVIQVQKLQERNRTMIVLFVDYSCVLSTFLAPVSPLLLRINQCAANSALTSADFLCCRFISSPAIESHCSCMCPLLPRPSPDHRPEKNIEWKQAHNFPPLVCPVRHFASFQKTLLFISPLFQCSTQLSTRYKYRHLCQHLQRVELSLSLDDRLCSRRCWLGWASRPSNTQINKRKDNRAKVRNAT